LSIRYGQHSVRPQVFAAGFVRQPCVTNAEEDVM